MKLLVDEENALRYACGSVGMKLLRKTIVPGLHNFGSVSPKWLTVSKTILSTNILLGGSRLSTECSGTVCCQ